MSTDPYKECSMNQIKLTFFMAQQISRRHTLISLMITVPLFLGAAIISLLIFKLQGYEDAVTALFHFYSKNKPYISLVVFFIYFVPVNYYAITRVLSSDFRNFQVKVFSKD
jgi:hypothetical protein